MKIELDGIVNDRLQELKGTWNKCYHETGNWHDMRFAIEQLFMAVYGNIDGVEKERAKDGE